MVFSLREKRKRFRLFRVISVPFHFKLIRSRLVLKKDSLENDNNSRNDINNTFSHYIIFQVYAQNNAVEVFSENTPSNSTRKVKINYLDV